jgi:hypothetical protein
MFRIILLIDSIIVDNYKTFSRLPYVYLNRIFGAASYAWPSYWSL